MAQPIVITYADGKIIEVPQTPWSEIQLERHYASGATLDSPVEAFYRLAWFAAQQAGQEIRDFEEFAKALADANSKKAPEPDRPTQPARRTTASSS